MKSRLPMCALVAIACAGEAADDARVDVVRVAPAQLLADSLEVTPALETAPNTPAQGRTALSIEVRVRNAAGTTKLVPAIGFRAVPEGARDTTSTWRFDITRRTVDSLRPGESATFGLTTAPDALAAKSAIAGVYRVEAVLGDSTTGRRTLPLGRIQLRLLADST